MTQLNADTDTISRAIYWRGLFIQRYSGIEFALAQLLVSTLDNPAYSAFGKLPFQHETRLTRLKQILAVDGPIRAFKEPIRDMLADFATFESERHFMAHAIMTIPRGSADRSRIVFRMYRHVKAVDPQPVDLEMTLVELEALARSMASISANFTTLVARISRQMQVVS